MALNLDSDGNVSDFDEDEDDPDSMVIPCGEIHLVLYGSSIF